MIQPIPTLPLGLREAALRGTLIPFIGAGASCHAGCPNWTKFADSALSFFVTHGKFSHAQLDQLSRQSPRVKLSIALALQRKHNLPIKFDEILRPADPNNNLNGRRLYQALSNLGKTFITTNYDDWLDITISAPVPSASSDGNAQMAAITEKRTVIYRVEEMTPDNLERPNTVFHLHGSVVDPASMVLTTQDYLRHYANDHRTNNRAGENQVLRFLNFLFAEKNVLFVGYGLEELEILEYVIGKARLTGRHGGREMRHFMLQGFFSHEAALKDSLSIYYEECGIEMIPFLRDEKDWEQVVDVLEDYAQRAPAGAPLSVQVLKEMEALLNG